MRQNTFSASSDKQMKTSAKPAEEKWKWGYSRWIGIHYGPIPVGLIAVVVLIAARS
jgi:hypothetical protein